MPHIKTTKKVIVTFYQFFFQNCKIEKGQNYEKLTIYKYNKIQTF